MQRLPPISTLFPYTTLFRSTIFALVIRYSQHGRTLTFAVRVAPRASRSEISGEHDCALRVRIARSEEHTSELQSRLHLVCRLLLEKKNSFRYIVYNDTYYDF